MWEEINLQEFFGEDMRGASHHFEDEWTDNGHHLLNSVLFTLPEIINLFTK